MTIDDACLTGQRGRVTRARAVRATTWRPLALGTALRGVPLALGLFGALGSTGTAHAVMPPWVYEQARRDAPNVIVLDVSGVEAPADPPANCLVRGKVVKVERGADYKVGQSVALQVPCTREGAPRIVGGTIWQDIPSLKAAPQGRAYLDAAGNVVLSQYERLP